jgi:hypothetical protein
MADIESYGSHEEVVSSLKQLQRQRAQGSDNSLAVLQTRSETNAMVAGASRSEPAASPDITTISRTMYGHPISRIHHVKQSLSLCGPGGLLLATDAASATTRLHEG